MNRKLIIICFTLVSLAISVNFLMILTNQKFAEKEKKNPNSTLKIIPRSNGELNDTESQLFIDEVEKFDNDIIELYTNTTVNITMIYKDLITGYNISGATVQLAGGGLSPSPSLVEDPVHGHYSYMLNTSHLAGITNFLTVFAQANYYESQSIDFSIVIIDIKTNLSLFLSNTSSLIPEDRTSNPYIKVVVDDFFNITIHYINNKTGKMITGAMVRLIGQGFDEILLFAHNQYTYVVNTNDPRLDTSINFLKIVATHPWYQSQEIDIVVQIIDRPTEIKIYLNGLDKTIERTLTLAYEKLLKIDVNYTDFETKQFISGATVDLVGEGISTSLTEGSLYTITINTSVLDIGIRFLTIFANKTNYQTIAATLRINITRIKTEIELLDYDDDKINNKAGEDITIRVKLNDLDFGRVITGARVNYTWEHGDGEMGEVEVGIYEVTLENVPEGTFTFNVTVYADDKYEFKLKVINITINRQISSAGGSRGDSGSDDGEDINILPVVIVVSVISGGIVVGIIVIFIKKGIIGASKAVTRAGN